MRSLSGSARNGEVCGCRAADVRFTPENRRRWHDRDVRFVLIADTRHTTTEATAEQMQGDDFEMMVEQALGLTELRQNFIHQGSLFRISLPT